MFNVGPLEMITVLIIALIVLGPQRLPDVARSLGRGMREFRSALDRTGDDEEEEPEYGYDPSQVEGPEPKPEGYQKDAESSEPSSSSRDLV